MTWLTGIFIYFLIWWLSLFAVLPFGVKRDDNPEMGHDGGAPVMAQIGKKIAYTTIVASILWLMLFVMMKMDILNYREIVSFK